MWRRWSRRNKPLSSRARNITIFLSLPSNQQVRVSFTSLLSLLFSLLFLACRCVACCFSVGESQLTYFALLLLLIYVTAAIYTILILSFLFCCSFCYFLLFLFFCNARFKTSRRSSGCGHGGSAGQLQERDDESDCCVHGAMKAFMSENSNTWLRGWMDRWMHG